ncbi:MAG: lactoylglutathione lyase [Actinobacteria bacterium]|nr:MAG: lactoylglutathione lyase [Actinomycetota bacterium]
MKPLGVHHVSINVDDADVAVSFYTEVLGLSLRDDRPDLGFNGAWLDLGDQQLHLLELTVPNDRGQHFAIQVEDIDRAIADVRSKGTEVGDASPIAGNRQAFLHDPSGNLVELHQPAK